MKVYKIIVGLVIAGVMLTAGASSTYAYSEASRACETQYFMRAVRDCEEPSRTEEAEAVIEVAPIDKLQTPGQQVQEISDVDWWMDVLAIQCGDDDVWVEIEVDDNGNETVVNGGCF